MQLKIFSPKVSKSLAVGARKRALKISQPAVTYASGWDLWKQADGEQEMAMLFLDIRNFTPLVESQSAFDVIHIIKKLFAHFQQVVQAHHGRIIETTGDGFYAAFGFDRHVKDAANDAVQSGQAILKMMDQFNQTSFEKNLGRKIEVGIGVHCGKVAIGKIQLGSEDHVVVMGYPVNVASRIQSKTKDFNNSFIISSRVYHLLNAKPVSRSVTDVNLKGVSETIELYLVGKAYHAEQMCLQ